MISVLSTVRFRAIAWLATCVAALASVPTIAAQRPPNVVMIVADDQGWTDFGCMGHPIVKTQRLDALVSTTDLAPTILTACGVVPPKEMPGLSLLETAAGNGRLARDAVFGEIYLHTAVDIKQPALNLTHRWIRAGDWKLIAFQDGKTPPELYDVKADPFEEQNLARAEPDKVRELLHRIDSLREPTGLAK